MTSTGLVWAEVKQLWNDGAKNYVQDMWNILDFTTNSLYIATFALKLVAYLRVIFFHFSSLFHLYSLYLVYFALEFIPIAFVICWVVTPRSDGFFQVEEEKRLGDAKADLPRYSWDAYDPNLISEGLFAAANIFSSLKLIYIFTVNPQLGPLQISLGRMVMDIMNFLFIAVLVIFSYACGVNQLYWYYAEARQKSCNECLDSSASKYEQNECECDRTLAKWVALRNYSVAKILACWHLLTDNEVSCVTSDDNLMKFLWF